MDAVSNFDARPVIVSAGIAVMNYLLFFTHVPLPMQFRAKRRLQTVEKSHQSSVPQRRWIFQLTLSPRHN